MNKRFFVIPVRDCDDAQDEYNRFASSVRLVKVRERFIEEGLDSFWCISADFIEKSCSKAKKSGENKTKVDYKEKLPAHIFTLYAKLRDWRNQEAARSGLIPYSVFTNEELAQMATKKVRSKEEMRTVKGVGDQKSENYGDDVIRIVKDYIAATGEDTDEKKHGEGGARDKSVKKQVEKQKASVEPEKDEKKSGEKKPFEKKNRDDKSGQLILPDS